jgi:excisionase family DNA binding protein
MAKQEKCLTMTIPEVAEMLGIGRNQAYEAARTGQIPTIRIGKRLIVSRQALENKLLTAIAPARTAAR